MSYRVCPICKGEGKVSPSWTFTGSEAAEAGPEFMEAYARGDYDKPCHGCRGLRVVEAERDVEAEEAESLDEIRLYAAESGDPELYYNPRLGL